MTGGRRIVLSTRRKVVFSAVAIALLVAAAEAAVRVRAWVRYGTTAASVGDEMFVRDPAIDLIVPRPGATRSGGRIAITINSLGFRGAEFSRQKPPDTIRIVCLGASTTFSSEASSDGATWPAILEARLRGAYPGIAFEVVNAGVPGHVAADALKNLRHRVLPLDPDLVIYYEANNEIAHDTRALAQAQGIADTAVQSPLVRTLSSVSLLFDLVHKNLAILSRGADDDAPRVTSIPADLPGRFTGVLEEMRQELAARDVPMLLSTFVVKYRRDQDRATQIANADVAFYYMPWMSIESLLSAMDLYNKAILDYAAGHGVPVVDDRNAVPADADHFADCMHFTDKGGAAMADRIFRFLQTSGLADTLVGRKRTAA